VDQSSQFLYHLDHPGSAICTNRQIVVVGWCYRLDGGTLNGIRATVRQRHFAGNHGQPRPDVARHFHDAPGSLLSGFRIPLTVAVGTNRIQIEVNSPTTGWLVLTETAITCQPPSRIARLLAWSKFAWRFRRSFREAWDGLTPEEQTSLRQFLETRDLFQLGNLVQHAPREIRHERLPTSFPLRFHLPRVSIVTPSFNQARFLGRTMESVLRQDHPRLDYLVVDGGSTDGSTELIRAAAPRLKYWASEPDRGQADALRKGFARIECAPADIVAYLNSDDTLFPGTVAFVARYFACHPEVDVIYGNRVLIDDNDREIGRWVSPRPDAKTLSCVDYVPQETLFWRKRMHDRVGGIDPAMHFAMDWDLLRRFFEAGAKIHRVPRFLGCFRVHAAQKTGTQIHDLGREEMDAVRLRWHGRIVSEDEIARAVELNRLESALLTWLEAKGIRL
jgi:hypothetical protein